MNVLGLKIFSNFYTVGKKIFTWSNEKFFFFFGTAIYFFKIGKPFAVLVN